MSHVTHSYPFFLASNCSLLFLYHQTRNPNRIDPQIINIRTMGIALSILTQTARIYFGKTIAKKLQWKETTVERVFDLLPFFSMGMIFLLTGMSFQMTVLTVSLFSLSQLNIPWSINSKKNLSNLVSSNNPKRSNLQTLATVVLNFAILILYRQTSSITDRQILNTRTVSIVISFLTQLIRPYINNFAFLKKKKWDQKRIDRLFVIVPFGILGTTFWLTGMPFQVTLLATNLFAFSHLITYQPNKQNRGSPIPTQPLPNILLEESKLLRRKVSMLENQVTENSSRLAHTEKNIKRKYKEKLKLKSYKNTLKWQAFANKFFLSQQINRDQWLEIEQLDAEMSLLENQRDTLEKQLKNMYKTVLILKKQIKSDKLALQNKDILIQRLSSNLKTKETREIILLQKVSQLENNLRLFDSSLSFLPKTMDEDIDRNALPGKYLPQKVKTLLQINKDLKIQVETNNSKLDQLEREIQQYYEGKLQENTLSYQKQITTWKNQYSISNQQVTNLSTKIQRLNDNIISPLINDKRTLTSQLNNRDGNITNLELIIEGKDVTINEKEQEITRLNEEIIDVNTTLRNYESIFSDFDKENMRLEKTIEHLETQLQHAQQSIIIAKENAKTTQWQWDNDQMHMLEFGQTLHREQENLNLHIRNLEQELIAKNPTEEDNLKTEREDSVPLHNNENNSIYSPP